MKLSKDDFNLEKDLCIALIYVTPVGSTRQNHIYEDCFQLLVNDIAEFEESGYEVLVAGDLNARTSTSKDYVEHDVGNQYVPLPDDYVSDCDAYDDFPYARASEDGGNTNEYGYRLLDVCKETGLRIVNGRVGADRGIGKLTCHVRQGSSVVDYVLTRAEYFHNITEFDVCDINVHSDHCALRFKILGNTINASIPPKGYKCYSWCKDHAAELCRKINSDYVQGKYNILRETGCSLTADGINRAVSIFTDTVNFVKWQILCSVKRAECVKCRVVMLNGMGHVVKNVMMYLMISCYNILVVDIKLK